MDPLTVQYLTAAASIATVVGSLVTAGAVYVAWKALEQIRIAQEQATLAQEHLRLVKVDLRSRVERSSKEYAHQQARVYAQLLVLFGERELKLQEEGIAPTYGGPTGDFDWDSIPSSHKTASASRINSGTMTTALNELEAVASAFVHGLADRDMVFPMMGQSFCGTVAKHYDILAHFWSRPNSSFYSHTIQLYRLWSAELTLKEIDAARTSIEKQYAAVQKPDLPDANPLHGL